MTSPIENGWQARRHRALHFTLYPIDYPKVDAQRFIDQLLDWKVTLFTFFAGGYTTAYPSALSWQPPSVHLPPGRDLVGEILEAADRAGIVAVPVIDLGDMRLDVARRHPEWAMWEPDGSIRRKARDYAISSPCGAYRNENARELVCELKQRYGRLFKGIKWGGASYGFGGGVDYNPEARRLWQEHSGRDLPEDTSDPEYRFWRESIMALLVERLTRIAREEGGVPTIGNSIWNLGQGQHFAALAANQTLSQVEVQTRTFLIQDDDSEGGWERFATPIETTRYVSALTENPPLVVASYFLAWPWRRVAVPSAEQYVYLAQVAANGGSPMVNMTAGLPDRHEDQRGFPAIRKLFHRMAACEDCFSGERSAARIAIVYDHASACAARRKGDLYRHYLLEMHGVQDALNQLHLPYDIVDSEQLPDDADGRYTALCLPAAEGLGDAALEGIRQLHEAGAGLVLTGSTATGPLGRSLGFSLLPEARPFTVHDEPGPCQAYLRVPEESHSVLEGIGRPWMAAAGHWYAAEALPEGAEQILTRARPLRLFPEGVAYAESVDPGDPLGVVLSETERGGRVCCFAFDAGRCAARIRHPDNFRLLANALLWAAEGRTGLRATGPANLRVSLRTTDNARIIHLIPSIESGRYATRLPVLRDIRLEIDLPGKPTSVTRVSGQGASEWKWEAGVLQLQIDEIDDYEIVRIEI